jgi:2-keto-3-deoxy-L-rhamnonate aldolase RhmA
MAMANEAAIVRNHAKDKLARGEVVSSMTVRLVRGVEIARIAKTAGFDSLYVDMEHSSFSLETTSQICMAALEIGITPFVRVPGPGDVQRILDAGALGIIAPHVQSADDARAYVRAAKYPPLGERSNAQSPAPSTVPLAAGRTGVCGDRRRHHGDRAVRERRSSTPTRSPPSRGSTWC